MQLKPVLPVYLRQMPFYFKRTVVFIVFICLASEFIAAQSRIDDLSLNGRKVSVYIPAGLKKNTKYPVLLFTDGQHCFGKGFNSLGLDILTDSLIKHRLMDPVIIIGIHSDQNRLNEYIPYLDSSIFNDFGYYQPRSIELIEFIKNELLPLIRSKYPANDTTGIAGFSFGGLLASWAALHYPGIFSFSAAFSPSMWVSDYKIFREASLADSSQVYYLDIGTAEWNYYLPFVKQSNLVPGKRVYYYEVKDAAHSIFHVGQRVHNALLIFNGKNSNTGTHWEVQTEVIESRSNPGKFYLRLNPVVELKNGLRYSLFYQVKFTVDNPGTGMVNEDGSFRFLKAEDMTVTVSWNGKTKKVRLNYKDIERRKSSRH